VLDHAVAAVNTSNGLLRATDPRFRRSVTNTPFKDAIGSGKELLLSLADQQSEVQWELALKVYDELAGVRLDWKLQNTTQKEIGLRTVTLVEAETGEAKGRSGTHVLSNGSNSWDYSHMVTLAQNSAILSSDLIAVDDPALVVGFLSANTTFGNFGYGLPPSQKPFIQASAEFNVILDPGQTRQADPLLVLFPSDVFEGLETYASAVQKFNDLKPRQQSSTAWCSWYSGYGRARQADLRGLEKAMLTNAQIIKTLKPWGIDTLRVVDDSDEQRYGDWTFPFVPHGMENLAASLRALGTKPGLWLAPAFVSETSDLFKQHPEWLQRYAGGELVTSRNFYGNTMHFLDVSNPQALDYLRAVFTRIKGWGFQYVMTDFLQWLVFSDRYHDPRMTRAEIYRLALRTIRETLGPEVYLLGCGAPQLASLGLVDGMRIGPDQWGDIGFENIASRYYEHGKWWLNDPDALVGNGSPVEEYRAWTTLAGLAGSVVTIGDDLVALSPEKLHILKRIHPVLGVSGKPIDLFQTAPSNQWLLETKGLGARSRVLGLFNWGNKEPLVHKIQPRQLLVTDKNVLVYDFWNDFFVAQTAGELTFTVPFRNVVALGLVEVTGAPQVLAVSNHLSQMAFGLKNVVWSAAEATLSGQTSGVPGDDYHLAVYVPTGYEPEQTVVGGRSVRLIKQEKNVWLVPVQGGEGPVQWSMKFRTQPPPAPAPAGGMIRSRVDRDLVYARVGNKALLLDLHRPEAPARLLPVILWIHGGAGRGGNKDDCPASQVLRHGYALACLNYRLSGEATFPAQIEDAKAAVRWLRASAAKYGLNTARIGAWGESAGGHLAALLGTAGGVKELEGREGVTKFSSRVQAVADFYGATDFLQMHGFPSGIDHDAPDSPESQLIGGPIQDNKLKVARANPITYASKDDPPFLIVHGDHDPLVPWNQSQLLYEALNRAGVEVSFHVLKGAGHGGAEFSTPQVNEWVVSFFERHLKVAQGKP
jgi:acetyl esterase/lipase